MAKQVVIIPDRLNQPADIEQDVFGADTEIITPCAKHVSEIDDGIWAQVDAILAWHELQYAKDIIDKLNRCKVIVRVGVGFDNVCLKSAGEKGIYVCNVPDYGTNDVADHTIGLMLTLARGIYAYSEKVRSLGSWDWEDAGDLHRLSDSTIGIIGLGRIGTATALRAKAFGMRIVFYDPYIPDGQDKALNISRCRELPELLNQSDVVSIHTPLTEETKGMAGSVFFEDMKEGAVFINTARGPIMELDALTKALRSGRLRAAALDVLPQEPPDPDHPLIQAWRAREPWIGYRLIITPHAAFYCREAYHEMRSKAALEAKRVLNGELPRNCVNQEWLKSNRVERL